MTTDTFTAPEQDPVNRDRYGRPLITPPGGGKPKPYTRCTTYVGALEDTYNLAKWQQRMVAIGLAHRPDYVLEVAGIGDLTGDPVADKIKKAKLDVVAEKAIEAAKASAAATVGTALHALAERHDRGQATGPIPAAYQADIEAYKTVTAGMRHKWVEQMCVQDKLQVAGTPDRITTYRGKRYIVDLKTGSIEWGASKIAMQLAMYAQSLVYDPATGERSRHDADLDRGIVIHLPAGTGRAQLYWVDLKLGAEGIRYARNTRQWRAYKFADAMEPIDQAPDTAGERVEAAVDPVLDAITAATTAEELGAVWREHRAAWTDEHTQAAAQRKKTLTA